MASSNPYFDLIDNLANVDLAKDLKTGKIKAVFYPSSASQMPVGWLLPEVYDALKAENTNHKGDYGGKEPYGFSSENGINRVFFSDSFNTRAQRSQAIQTTVVRWRELALKGDPNYVVFKSALKTNKFGEELFAVHEDPDKDLRSGNNSKTGIVCDLPSHAACLFSFVHYGAHITLCHEDSGEWKIWVQKREDNKS